MELKSKKKIISAQLEEIKVTQRASVHVGKYSDSFFRRSWHYHPEFELLLITKGHGTRMVGDNFEPFHEGDLVLLGGNLPHAWISDPQFVKNNIVGACESVYIQFRKSVFGAQFIDIPEMESIRKILVKAGRGLKITGKNKVAISNLLMEMPAMKPLEQIVTLIRILDLFHHSDFEILASENYGKQRIYLSDKMIRVHNYIMQNFQYEINVNDCAEYVKMTTTSFCRFFKKQTKVSFTVYLNYLRINLARNLLRNTQMPIKEIAFDCGYSSHVYFNQKFKSYTGMSPKAYRENLCSTNIPSELDSVIL